MNVLLRTIPNINEPAIFRRDGLSADCAID
jgi:hypothetical protein